MSAPKRFEAKLDEDRLNDLQKRLDRACEEAERKPEPTAVWEMDKKRLGMTHDRHRQLLFAWPDHDTWKAFEKRLNTFDHYMSQIEDINMHFIWERAATDARQRRPVIPLVLLHGWPSSVLDFFNTIHPLAHPGATSPSDVPAFDVVVPSQTGYLWSSSPRVDQFGRGQHSGPQGDILLKDEARLVHKLMLSLGYRKYAIQAGDWSNVMARLMARMYPDHVVAVHLNFCPAGPPNIELPLVHFASHFIPQPIKNLAWAFTPTHYFMGFPRPLNDQDRKKLQRSIPFIRTGSGYAIMQGTRPSTLGLVLQSDPAALLAWIGEKYIEWTDDDPSDAEICAQLTLYWCTDTMARSIYNYRNRVQPSGSLPRTDPNLYINQPFGMSDFPFEVLPTPVEWMRRSGNLQWYRKHSKGGHFASLERPANYVEDVRDCFAKIWKP
ncbi:alpha/beta-hydrolase [Meira miltonrushii]|uniref:Alpha/beta-hydrolase n=1 Tax=Meira miltonrushii TaxID=1280837 RepID=A0A316VFE5_9BASI|nr:alpha/beta-hydrolase [Meira miltonrushii]PWN36302.1 alpha/beta-hydrolase [Meira miltonrushii]